MLRFDLKGIPALPGIYRFYDASGKPTYVGRAKILRRRLGQYLHPKRGRKHRKMRLILQKSSRVDWETCSSHAEACLLEIKLIQILAPPLNQVAAFSRYYPYVGLVESGRGASLRLSVREPGNNFDSGSSEQTLGTKTDFMPSIQWFGAFRSLSQTKAAVSAFRELTDYINQSLEPGAVRDYWSGQSERLLQSLFYLLLDQVSARRDRVDVQEKLRLLRVFYRSEPRRLRGCLDRLGDTRIWIPQQERDVAFEKLRLRNY